MKIVIDLWHKVGFMLEVLRYRPEVLAFGYFACRTWVWKYELFINLYSYGREFMFHINMPFFGLTNAFECETISLVITEGGPIYKTVPVITGKIFGQAIRRCQKTQ